MRAVFLGFVVTMSFAVCQLPPDLEKVDYATLGNWLADPSGQIPVLENLVEADSQSFYSGRCFKSDFPSFEKNGLLTLVATKGTYRFYPSSQKGPADYFDERLYLERTQPGEPFFNGVKPPVKSGNKLVYTHSSVPTGAELMVRGKYLFLSWISEKGKEPARCVFFKNIGKKTWFEMAETLFNNPDAAHPGLMKRLFSGRKSFSIALRCYDENQFAMKPTNGLLFGNIDKDGFTKIAVIQDAKQAPNAFDQTVYEGSQVSWLSDVGTVATNGHTVSSVYKPANLRFEARWLEDVFEERKVSTVVGARIVAVNKDGSTKTRLSCQGHRPYPGFNGSSETTTTTTTTVTTSPGRIQYGATPSGGGAGVFLDTDGTLRIGVPVP